MDANREVVKLIYMLKKKKVDHGVLTLRSEEGEFIGQVTVTDSEKIADRINREFEA